MTDQIRQIAARMKELRELSGFSSESIASLMNIPVKQYQDYESGQSDIPVSFLFKLAQHYKVELSAILTGDYPHLHIYSVVRKDNGLHVERRKAYKYESLAFNFMNKKAEPFLVTIQPGSEPGEFNTHEGQEFNFILEGSVKVLIDNHQINLEEGDSLYFDSRYKHSMIALKNKPARILAFIV
jgi:transcriptional regulator with XRE-family HTH domain